MSKLHQCTIQAPLKWTEATQEPSHVLGAAPIHFHEAGARERHAGIVLTPLSFKAFIITNKITPTTLPHSQEVCYYGTGLWIFHSLRVSSLIYSGSSHLKLAQHFPWILHNPTSEDKQCFTDMRCWFQCFHYIIKWAHRSAQGSLWRRSKQSVLPIISCALLACKQLGISDCCEWGQGKCCDCSQASSIVFSIKRAAAELHFCWSSPGGLGMFNSEQKRGFNNSPPFFKSPLHAYHPVSTRFISY